jgi:enterochelin esterase-like enzyme
MGSYRNYYLYLPPTYATEPARRYPVLYLLHGDGGSAASWLLLGIQNTLDRAIAGQGLPDLIVVMPDGSAPDGSDTDWANRWDGTDPVENSVLELVSDIDGAYRTLNSGADRFIGGYSAGGFGALNIAVQHPGMFSVAMSFNGFTAANDPAADPVFGSDPGFLSVNSPINQDTQMPAGTTPYFVLTGGESDAYFTSLTQAFAALLQSAGIASEFHVVPGGHDPRAWNAGLGYGLAYLANRLQPPVQHAYRARLG